MNLNYDKAAEQALKLSQKAVPVGLVREADGNYLLSFNRATSNYDVTGPNGEHVASFRTYKITEAKRWLREYLNG